MLPGEQSTSTSSKFKTFVLVYGASQFHLSKQSAKRQLLSKSNAWDQRLVGLISDHLADFNNFIFVCVGTCRHSLHGRERIIRGSKSGRQKRSDEVRKRFHTVCIEVNTSNIASNENSATNSNMRSHVKSYLTNDRMSNTTSGTSFIRTENTFFDTRNDKMQNIMNSKDWDATCAMKNDTTSNSENNRVATS